jgi:hypothetical protein
MVGACGVRPGKSGTLPILAGQSLSQRSDTEHAGGLRGHSRALLKVSLLQEPCVTHTYISIGKDGAIAVVLDWRSESEVSRGRSSIGDPQILEHPRSRCNVPLNQPTAGPYASTSCIALKVRVGR